MYSYSQLPLNIRVGPVIPPSLLLLGVFLRDTCAVVSSAEACLYVMGGEKNLSMNNFRPPSRRCISIRHTRVTSKSGWAEELDSSGLSTSRTGFKIELVFVTFLRGPAFLFCNLFWWHINLGWAILRPRYPSNNFWESNNILLFIIHRSILN
jgi:hypothetical protein